MTVERMEGTDEADEMTPESAETTQASAVTAAAESPESEAPTTAADAPLDSPEASATPDAEPATAASEEPPATAGEAPAEASAATSDPSPEAALGSSGARPLGDASEIADRAVEAVEQAQPASSNGTEPVAELAPDNGGSADSSAMDSSAVGVSAGTEDGSMGDGSAELGAASSAGPEAASSAGPEAASSAQPAAESIEPGAEASRPAAEATEPAAEATGPAKEATEAAAEAQVPAVPAPRVYEGPEPTTMEELLNEQATEIRSLKHGDVVEGNVVRIDKDEILVDIGAKSEGVISNRELYGRNAESQPQLSIGDQVLVYVLQPESPEGHAVLSLRRAGLERKWRAMQEQLDAGEIIEAPVIDHNKGGLIVDCGIRGFVPISQIVDFPRRPQNEQPRDAAQEIAEKLQPYVGRKLRLKILEVNRKANRLILSEKVALYEERREKRDELFSSLQVGQKVTGTVRSIAPFGVFVDLGGIDGLVHKSELSWNKVNNPEAGYRVGEEVEAEVIDINHERGRISLSIRRLQPDPWHSTVADMNVGDVIDGTVTKIVNFGAFVRVRDGLEGLIHISELSHQRVNHPGDVVHEGQTIKLKIISLDQERHRLGLSLKQAEEPPARTEPTERRERRPRADRGGGYDMSQAVQEPEGGIDNTLAAAFAQVRQQIEETEAARSTGDEGDAAEAADEGEATSGAPVEAAAKVESSAAVSAEAEPATEPAAEPSANAEPAAEPAADAKPARKRATKAKAEPAVADEAPAAEATADAPAEAPAAEEAPAADEAPEPAEPAEAGASADAPAEGSDDAAPAEGADREEPQA